MSDTPETPRRTVRRRNKPQKYGDFLELAPVKRHVQEDTSSEDDNDFDDVPSQKPTALFSNDDVKGQDMFKFKSRHTKHDLQNKVKDLQNNSLKLESPLKTPRKNLYVDSVKKVIEATPKVVKDIIKKRIVKEVDSGSDEDDFSGSSSDFVPDDSESEASSASSSSASEEEEEKDASVETKPASKVQGRGRGKARPKDSEYIVTPDNYFMMNSSKKIATSDHTLARLKNLNLDDNMEKDNDYISEEHKSKITELNQSYEQVFDKWMYILSEDFNIVLYGIGSKRSVLHQFQKKKLSDYPCIVVNGFFPSLTIKSILESIVMDLLKCSHVPSNVGDVVKLIETRLSDEDTELFLIIHNIDGTMLRNAKAQTTLASLCQIKNVHTIATIDHINAPLLWDHNKLSKLRFTWWDVTTFLPYSEETSYENSLMSHRSGALQLSSLKSVHQSLTTNAKGIFNIIIQYQLDNHKQPHYQGLPFKELYSKSREQFLVSSDIALRAQLTEFLDHKLVKMKRTYDGSENLVIPIDNSLLQQFLEQNS
ncbi:origin recognition complex subunit 2 [Cydia pomonella]|uniref:origin recognition complex subunit 2 n=1 Tax=Cydia pomonella TaxID=82600 RepID=UPI002ADE0918|nr:origin recognition complex subunit 2 [Cydia pomonella]XP_061711161.1 origin recognition complex subunit 2 [Cydia pomonella]